MIKINQGYWSPLVGRIAAFAILATVTTSFLVPMDSLASYLVRIILIVLCAIVMTSRNFLVFNLRDNTYFEYLWLFGFKLGRKERFDSIEKLFVNKINLVSQAFKYSPWVAPDFSEVRTSIYKCFIKFGNGEKMLLDSDEDKDKLIHRLKDYNKVLKTTLYDTTSHETLIID